MGVFGWFAGDRLNAHTQNDHFAVQAELWHEGRWYLTEEDISARHRRGELDMNNDWAVMRHIDPSTKRVEVRYFNSFPIFPAVLMYPFVVAAGSALLFRDALFVVALAGVAPALLFIALERLRRDRRIARSQNENVAFALLYAFGSVYFFTAVQGTVWFAAHVVGAALTGGYLLATLGCESFLLCLIAGIMVGCGAHTRPPFLLCVPFFAYEAARQSLRTPVRKDGSWSDRARDFTHKIDKQRLFARYALFAIPIVAALAINLAINRARFDDPFEFGHKLLNVVWMERVKRWGLFSYHYLSRNLTCAFTLLPIINPAHAPNHVARVQVSGNGLALWVTTPLFFWLLWPRVRSSLHWALVVTAAAIALPDLLYQNSGWIQFGYRFSNDFSPYLFVLLALGARPTGWMFRAAATWSVIINTFGAISFDRHGFQRYYSLQTYVVPIYDGTPGVQSVTYPPD
ncbi:MAG: hypothetical protein NVS3B20_01430 [Polyangiales bacterium]